MSLDGFIFATIVSVAMIGCAWTVAATMSFNGFLIATIVSVAMIGSYLWGYREGFRHCVRELKPFEDLLKQLADSRNKKP